MLNVNNESVFACDDLDKPLSECANSNGPQLCSLGKHCNKRLTYRSFVLLRMTVHLPSHASFVVSGAKPFHVSLKS